MTKRDRRGCQVLGLTFDGRPIFEPRANASGMIYAAMSGSKATCGALPAILDKVTNTLIDEPVNDERNPYWRESPRDFLHAAIRIVLAHDPGLLTPGAPHGLLADPHAFESALACEAEDPSGDDR